MCDYQGAVQIVYDGECPFCLAYVRLATLRETVWPVEMINAREAHPILAEIQARSVDLNEGMVLKMCGRLYHGDECIHVLALLGSPSGVFNRVMRGVFGSRTASRQLYPLLRCGRIVALALLRRRAIKVAAAPRPCRKEPLAGRSPLGL